MNLPSILRSILYNLANIPSHLYTSVHHGIRSTLYAEWTANLDTIPQFILDLRHPWIKANLAELKHRPNVAAYLCQVDGVMHIDNEIPDNLFDHLIINNYATEWKGKLPGWGEALDRLREIQWCKPAVDEALSLEVKIHVHNPDSTPPKELIERFASLLGYPYPFWTLVWDMPCEQTVAFAEEFVTRGIKHGKLRELTIGPWSEYMVGMFPGLEALTFVDFCGWKAVKGRPAPYRLVINEAAKIPGIRSLSFSPEPDAWSPGLLEGWFTGKRLMVARLTAADVLTAMPKLTHVGMGGLLRVDGLRGGDEQILQVRAGLFLVSDVPANTRLAQTYLKILAKFPNLRYLDLPSSMDLDIGEHGWKETGEVMEKAGAITLETLPHLERLSIGGYQAKIMPEQPRTKDAVGRDSKLFPGVSFDKTEL